MGLSPPLSIFPLLLYSRSLCGEESLWDDWSNKLTFTFGKLRWLVLKQNTSQKPKHVPESEPAPSRIRKTSQNLRTHPRIQKHFPQSETDSGTCSWILGCVLDSILSFKYPSHRGKRLQTRPTTPSSHSSPEARQLRCILTRPHIKHLPTHHNSVIVYENEVTRLQDIRFQWVINSYLSSHDIEGVQDLYAYDSGRGERKVWLIIWLNVIK